MPVGDAPDSPSGMLCGVMVPEPGAPVVVHSTTLLDAAGPVDDGWLSASDGLITDRGRGDGWRHYATDGTVVDGSRRMLLPGFVDLHVHGGGGFSHEEGPEAVLAATAAHRRHGTTRSVISFVSDTVDVLAERLSSVADLMDEHPEVLGSHLEGPFLAESRRGAHSASRLCDPSPTAVRHLLTAARGTLRQVTLDPQRAGASEASALFLQAGVTVAVGHTECGYAQAREAFLAGARLLTHAFNAMPGIQHRAPGPVMAALDDPTVTLELILDGEHVHPRVAAMVFAAAPGRVALVTDAMAGAAAPDGRYALGEVAVDVHGGRAVIHGTETLAGSTLTMAGAVRIGVAHGLPLTALVEAATVTPARAIGLGSRIGRLAPGWVADLVLLDRDLGNVSVYSSGVRV